MIFQRRTTYNDAHTLMDQTVDNELKKQNIYSNKYIRFLE